MNPFTKTACIGMLWAVLSTCNITPGAMDAMGASPDSPKIPLHVSLMKMEVTQGAQEMAATVWTTLFDSSDPIEIEHFAAESESFQAAVTAADSVNQQQSLQDALEQLGQSISTECVDKSAAAISSPSAKQGGNPSSGINPSSVGEENSRLTLAIQELPQSQGLATYRYFLEVFSPDFSVNPFGQPTESQFSFGPEALVLDEEGASTPGIDILAARITTLVQKAGKDNQSFCEWVRQTTL